MSGKRNGVGSALDNLLEELQEEEHALVMETMVLMQDRLVEQAHAQLDRQQIIIGYIDQVNTLRSSWEAFFGQDISEEEIILTDLPEGDGSAVRPLRTPEIAFYRPILEALEELGGEAAANDVLNSVYEKLQTRLTRHDREGLSSDATLPRWRNAAMWARNTLVQDGRLERLNNKGSWRISDRGRQWLQDQGIRS